MDSILQSVVGNKQAEEYTPSGLDVVKNLCYNSAMTKPVVLSEKAWLKIYNQIAKEYPPSVLLIRDKMREVLGFTSRTHQSWINQEVDIKNIKYGTKYCITTIHLDFYSEPKRTMFLLKYSEFLNKSGNTDLDI